MDAGILSASEVRCNLRAAVDAAGLNLAVLSKQLGKNPSYLHQFINRGTPRRLHQEDRILLAEILGLSDFELGGLKVSSLAKPAPPSEVSIGILGISDGSIDEKPSGSQPLVGKARLPISMLPEWPEQDIDSLIIIKVQGDAMHPTLKEGDHVLVDSSEKRATRDGVYVFKIGENFQFKRVFLHPTGKETIVGSDNPLFESWKETRKENLSVFGRVIMSFCRL